MIYETELSDITERLHNWCAWYKDRQTQRVTFSLEGRYKSEEVFDEQKQARPPIDVKDAVRLEAVIVSLPDKQKNIIKYAYLKRIHLKDKPIHNFNVLCRKLGINQRDYEEEEKRAHLMVKNMLKMRIAA